jgi:hypothetical protein
VLKKRENFRKAFAGFDIRKVAKFDDKKVAALMQDEGIIRNRLKVVAAINNAQRFMEVQKEFGSFDQVYMGLYWRQTAHQSPGDAKRSTTCHRYIQSHEQRPDQKGLQIRRGRLSAMPSCRQWEQQTTTRPTAGGRRRKAKVRRCFYLLTTTLLAVCKPPLSMSSV